MATFEETIKMLKSGGIEAEEVSSYKPARVKITDVIVDDGDNAKIDHPLIASQKGKGIVWIVFKMDVKFLETNEVVKHTEVISMYTSSGRLNYSPLWVNSDGETVPETPLHEFKRRCSEQDDKQVEKFGEKFNFSEDLFKNMIFEIGAKRISDTSIILETERQKQKDKEYRESQQVGQPQESESKVQPIDDDELPF